MNNGLYYLDNNDKYKLNASDLNESNAMVKNNSCSKYIWDLRLSHVAEDRIAKLEKMRILSSSGSEPTPTCESCLQGKMTSHPFLDKG